MKRRGRPVRAFHSRREERKKERRRKSHGTGPVAYLRMSLRPYAVESVRAEERCRREEGERLKGTTVEQGRSEKVSEAEREQRARVSPYVHTHTHTLTHSHV